MLEYRSAGVVRLIEFAQHSMTPLLHHSAASPDHSIRPCQHIRRNREPALLGRLQVNDELEFSHLFLRQYRGLDTL